MKICFNNAHFSQDISFEDSSFLVTVYRLAIIGYGLPLQTASRYNNPVHIALPLKVLDWNFTQHFSDIQPTKYTVRYFLHDYNVIYDP